ncbi:MAG: winged helix-turn-helix transcriptional regulator [Phyllobacteriaceae bacterium]|nr:winged helix-turn-helix transcriptional regulator [Phyllobacteriaceae bacterium]
MARGIDPDSFGFLVNDVARLVRAALDRRIAVSGLGLTPGEARVLAHAARLGPVRQSALAESALIEPMTLSTYVDGLAGKALVERAPDPVDRRARLVRLTPKADATLDQVGAIAAEIRLQAASDIDAADWELLKDLLKAVRKNLEKLDRETDIG